MIGAVMNMDELFMREALALAREAAAEGEVPVGCVIVDGETVVGGDKKRPEPRRARGDRRRMPPAGRLAAVEMHALCDARTLPDVRGGDH